jgi:hypothetical protein
LFAARWRAFIGLEIEMKEICSIRDVPIDKGKSGR